MALSKNQLDALMASLQRKSEASAMPTFSSVAETPSGTNVLNSIRQQSSNAAFRLQNVGVDTQPMEDTRNPLERALNLTPDQNFLFDILEVINRPQQAIFGGIIEGMDEGKLWSSEGAAKGWTGNEKYWGGQIVRGVLDLEDKEGVDWTDVAGFALDAFLDPADIGLALVTFGASTGATVAGTVADVAKTGAKVAGAVDTMTDATAAIKAGASAVNAGSDAVKVLKPGKFLRPDGILGSVGDFVFGKGAGLYVPKDGAEYLKLFFDKNYRMAMGIEKISVTSALFKTGTAGFKGTLGFSDALVELGLGKMGDEFLESYKAAKHAVSTDLSDIAGRVKRAGIGANQRAHEAYSRFKKKLGIFDEVLVELAGDTDVKKFGEQVFTFYEYKNLPNKKYARGDFLNYILDSHTPAVKNTDDVFGTLNKWFGEDFVNKHVTKGDYEGVSYLIFDKKFWNPDNEALMKILREDVVVPKIWNKTKITEAEIALKNTDPEAYEQYLKMKNAETAVGVEGGFQSKVEQKLQEKYRRANKKMPTDEKLLVPERKAIEESLRKDMLVRKQGSENFLRSKVKEDSISDVLLDKDIVANQVDKLNVTDKVAYKKAYAEDMQEIDKMIAESFPSANTPADISGKAVYNKRRARFAETLRKDPSNFPNSQAVLNGALANPSPDELFKFDSFQDFLDDFNYKALNKDPLLEYYPDDIKKTLKEYYKKLSKINESTGDTSVSRLNLKTNLENFYNEKIVPLQPKQPAVIEDLLKKPEVAPKKVSKKAPKVEPVEAVDPKKALKQAQFDVLNQPKVLKKAQKAKFKDADSVGQLDDFIVGFKGADDFSSADARLALRKDSIKVYAVETVNNGTVVTPSQNSARKMAAGGKYYTKTVSPKDIAWYDSIEGVYAKVPDEVVTKLKEAPLPPSPSLKIGGETVKVPTAEELGIPLLDEAPPASSFAPQPNIYQQPPSDTITIGKLYTDEQIAAFEEMAKDPRIVKGAERFGEMIEDTQRFIGELEFGNPDALLDASMRGYATHTLSLSSQDIVDRITKHAKLNNVKTSAFFPGNISSLSKRGYDMSALEANHVRKVYNSILFENDEWFKKNVPEDMVDMVKEYFNQDLFSVSARESIIGLMDDKYLAINANNRMIDMLAAMSFGDPYSSNAAIRRLKANEEPIKGFSRISPKSASKLKRSLTQMKEYSGSSYFIDGIIQSLESKGGVAVEDHMLKLLGLVDKNNAEAGLKALDTFHNMFKALKTANPVGFNSRNFIGNNFNMWASGMSVPEIVRYWNRSMDYVGKYYKGDKAIQKIVAEKGVEALSPAQLKIHKAMTDMMQNGYFDLSQIYKLNDMDDFIKAKKMVGEGGKKAALSNPLLELNMKMNLWTDNRARMALYLYALDNPGYASRLGIEGMDAADSAMKTVRTVLFDPNDLSLWEESFMKRIIPFYTFTRQNMAFQIRNLSRNSEKYYRLYKSMNALYEAQGVGVDEVSQFERDQFYIPFIGQKDGKYLSIKTAFPINDLIEMIDDPMRRFMSATSPLIRTPFEELSGTSTFTGRPIENYEGEMSKNIPFLTKKWESRIGQIGADVPTRTATGAIDVISSLVKGEPMQSGVLNRATGMVHEGDLERTKLAREYEKLNALTDKIRVLKAQGKTVPTLDEIAKARSGSTDANKARMAALQGIMEMMENKKR